MEQRTFSIAGVVARVESPDGSGFRGISGYYDEYAAAEDGSPDVIISAVVDPDFRGRPAVAEAPGLDTREVSEGRVHLWREDVEGFIDIPEQISRPVRASFTSAGYWGTEAAIRIALSITLPRRSGFILHSSAVKLEDKAFVFSGRSGAGKSTIANLLVGEDPERLKLADELLVIRQDEEGGQWRAHVAPFHGLQGLPHGHTAPVAAVHFLSHAASHSLHQLSMMEVLSPLLGNVLVYVSERRTAERLLAVVTDFAQSVACYRLDFARAPGIAGVLRIA